MEKHKSQQILAEKHDLSQQILKEKSDVVGGIKGCKPVAMWLSPFNVISYSLCHVHLP